CFPNPAKRHISLNTDIQEAFMLELTTAEGRILQQWHIDRPQPQTVLSLPELPAGLYFLRMECNGKTTSRRLIVK
ncbi:MAG TPA: T9SS type A sorting domain-containing protein, partial [Phaeodactylibacter sp.]|nr:T9SS type A sorting domain-containing protein [Phaeodactylibacter sp.]